MSTEKRVLDYIPKSLQKQLREEVLEEIEAEKKAAETKKPSEDEIKDLENAFR